MKNKIAIVKSGFMDAYLDYFMQECSENGVKVSVYNSLKEISEGTFDYVLTDCMPDKVCCNVFHTHTILQRVKTQKFLPARIIFFFGHLDKVCKTLKLYKNMERLICVSETLKKDFIENYNISPEKIIVANPGFNKKKDNDLKIFRKYNYERPFVIGLDARGFVNKGGYILLEALRYVHKYNPEIKLLAKIIYPKYKTNLALKFYVKFFKLSAMVEFLDLQKDMESYYESLDCLVCASILESFGRVVPEAMYSKIPVIVGSNVGASDIIEDNVNGFIFDADKQRVLNLAQKILQVYRHHESFEQQVETAYELSKLFTWQHFAKQIFNALYQNIPVNK